MRYGSVCSGVEAATLAWRSLGWECKFVAEVEPFPCAVLQARFGASRPIHPLDPDETDDEDEKAIRKSWIKQNEKLDEFGIIPNEGDFTKIGDKYRGKIDLLVGGTPCQDLSVAGKRAGFGEDDEDAEKTRSSLAIDFVELAYKSECRWFIWATVPGVFSSNGGGGFRKIIIIVCRIRGWSARIRFRFSRICSQWKKRPIRTGLASVGLSIYQSSRMFPVRRSTTETSCVPCRTSWFLGTCREGIT